MMIQESSYINDSWKESSHQENEDKSKWVLDRPSIHRPLGILIIHPPFYVSAQDGQEHFMSSSSTTLILNYELTWSLEF